MIETLPAIETAVAQAEDTRAEVRVAQAQVTEAVYQKRAARAEQLPSLEFWATMVSAASHPPIVICRLAVQQFK